MDNALMMTDGSVVDTSSCVVNAIGEDAKFGLVGWKMNGKYVVRVVNKAYLNVPKNFNRLFESREPKL
jgi:hypothetical protein